MWTHEESIETTATPAQIWALFADVRGWKKWNAGIDRIEIRGPFLKGTTFSMQPPGTEAFTSTLLEVAENEKFTDETVIDDTRVLAKLVHHTIRRLPSGHTQVTYSTQITGANAEAFGPMVTADFPQVLQALKSHAKSCVWKP